MTVGTSWDAVTAERYDYFATTHGFYRVTSADLVAHLAPSPGSRVAEVGCGNGVTTATLLDCLGPDGSVVAIDASVEMLGVARRRVADSRVTWLEGRAEQVLADARAVGRLNGAVANSVIWQIPTAVFSGLRSRIGPGARFVFNLGSSLLGLSPPPHNRPRSLAEVVSQVAAEEFGYRRPPRPPQEQYLGPRSPESLRALLSESGWQVHQEWRLAVPTTPEAQHDWLRVPVFSQHVLRGLSDEYRLAILERAYELWDKDCSDVTEDFYCLSVIAI